MWAYAYIPLWKLNCSTWEWSISPYQQLRHIHYFCDDIQKYLCEYLTVNRVCHLCLTHSCQNSQTSCINPYPHINIWMLFISPWRRDDDDSSHATPVAFNRIYFYCDNFPTCFPQKTRKKLCNTGKPNSICSESRQQCSRGFFWVTIYLEYNTAEGKTKILTCLRLAQALLLPPGVNEFVQIHHPLHHPKAY